MTKSDELVQIASKVGEILIARGWRLAAVESCTGGWIAKTVTSISGSSDWFECGLVTYSNASKVSLAGVPESLISRHGAVSAEVAKAMVTGVLDRTDASAAVSLTGIAGPGGGSAEKPVGTVYMGWQLPGVDAVSERFHFHGARDEVRWQSVATALSELARIAQSAPG
ncbi:MAG TPA: damage-inducible protein CinA [Gammaproteobacteria bacterium]|jgi:nicotinamide-nucleotide amidase|nr:damage-inducible protein CinA [Acidiferrobacteraceae bacterium]MDP6399700.1 CinA family protein [Arenicellales bacterium]HCX86473.1 damage-inducible protein CinA [Gammaproteobacteria bacterium]MDP6552198.1 CinA family protein [Arenicellales bacterium]MDP6791824.1 CinA family protein [Arenicellales bacterium]|tara:strand:+ start:749 stop:1252 length:504 start_codon:yes stop_codon:yes gene_type:complete